MMMEEEEKTFIVPINGSGDSINSNRDMKHHRIEIANWVLICYRIVVKVVVWPNKHNNADTRIKIREGSNDIVLWAKIWKMYTTIVGSSGPHSQIIVPVHSSNHVSDFISIFYVNQFDNSILAFIHLNKRFKGKKIVTYLLSSKITFLIESFVHETSK